MTPACAATAAHTPRQSFLLLAPGQHGPELLLRPAVALAISSVTLPRRGDLVTHGHCLPRMRSSAVSAALRTSAYLSPFRTVSSAPGRLGVGAINPAYVLPSAHVYRQALQCLVNSFTAGFAPASFSRPTTAFRHIRLASRAVGEAAPRPCPPTPGPQPR
jgi:hypothetical protein